MTVSPDQGELAVWVKLVRRRWRTGAAVFLPLFLLVAALVLTARPIYRAEARLRLSDPPPASGVSPSAGVIGFFRLGGDPFANDLELLASRSVAEGTVVDAALNATVAAPRGWHRDSLFTQLTTTSGTERATFEAEWTALDRVSVRMVSPKDSVIGEVAAGELLAFGGLTVSFRPRAPDGPQEIQIRTLPFGDAVRVTKPRIAVKRPRREANVLVVAVQDADPGLARAALGAAVSRFIELRTMIQRRESGAIVDSLETVASRTRDELRLAERAIATHQEVSRLVAPADQATVFAERYGEAVSQLELANAEIVAVAALLARADSIPDRTRAWTELVSHPRFLQNETVGAVLAQLVALEQRRLELGARRTEASRELRILEEQIVSLDRTLRTLVLGYRDGLAEQANGLRRQVARMDAELAGLPEKGVALARLQREARILSEVLILTEQRLRQEALREALTFANVQVVDPPALLYKPVWPRKRFGLGIGFIIAAVFATLGMIVRDRLDGAVRTASDIKAAIAAPLLTVAVRQDGEPLRIAAPDAEVAIRHLLGDGSATGRGGSRVALVPVDEGPLAGDVAAALNGAVRAGRRVENFAGAVAAVADSAPVVFVLEWGRTGRAELERAAALVRQAGGRVAGAILVVPSARQASAVWE